MGRVADQVDSLRRAHGEGAHALELDGGVGVLVGREVLRPRDGGGGGADQREQAPLERALVQLDRVADLEAADHVEQPLQRDALGVEQELRRRLRRILAQREDAQVAEHLSLVREEGRVAALARAQVRELVRHLAVEELDRSGARQRELAALGAIQEPAPLAQRPVVLARGWRGPAWLRGGQGHGLTRA